MKERLKIALMPLLIGVLSIIDLLLLANDNTNKGALVLIYLVYPMLFIAQGFYLKKWTSLLISTGLGALAVFIEPLYWFGVSINGVTYFLGFSLFYIPLSLSFFFTRKKKLVLGLSVGIVLGILFYFLVTSSMQNYRPLINLLTFLAGPLLGVVVQYKLRTRSS